MKIENGLHRQLTEFNLTSDSNLQTVAAALVLSVSLLAPAQVRAQVGGAIYQPTSHSVAVFETYDDKLYEKYWNGTEWVWDDQGSPPGAIITGVPSAIYQPTSHPLITFVTDGNGHLLDKYWDGTKWLWEDQGTPGVPVFGSSAVYQPTSHPLIDFVGGLTNGHLYDKYWNGTNWVWEDQGTPPGTTALYVGGALYQPTSHPLVVFVTGADGQLFDKYWNGTEWVWEKQGTPPGDIGADALLGLSTVYDPSSHSIFVFMEGTLTNNLYDKFWDGAQWVWKNQGKP
jgi:hypothetical protein